MSISNSVQKKIDKAKSVRDNRTIAVFLAGSLYAVTAHFLASGYVVSPVLIPLSIGIGAGLLIFGFSLTINFETTKRLILMEDKLETKLEEISSKVATQSSIDSVIEEKQNNQLQIQILEIKNEVKELKELMMKKKIF